MNQKLVAKLLLAFTFFFSGTLVSAQLQIIAVNNAQTLAQKLVGDGVIISNATLTSSPSIIPTGFFSNLGGTNIGIDSGIVLTCGRAKSDFRANLYGVNGNGTFPASARRADDDLGLPGDTTLATEMGIPVSELNDAIALEFDFVPLGDSIRFNYILSSEEYTTGTVCIYNDAFGFFISGPGIIGNKNIALIPGTSTPVTITNVNNITTATCINNPQYYVDNTSNVYFIHEGHTTLFVATSRVQPCQTYHLKLVIADQGDHAWDSGVFIEAKSLNSNTVKIANLTHTDNQGNSYLAEGCASGSFTIRRQKKDPFPLNVTLSYGGSALNGTDVQLLPAIATIPANDSIITVNVVALADGIPEGIEILKVYALAACSAATAADSAIIQIRDYDTLIILPRDTNICKRSSIQLNAFPGYHSYQWDPAPTLSNLIIGNPVATPVATSTTYICTAMEGTCQRRDSVHVNIIPPVKISAGRDTIAAIGQPIQLHAFPISQVNTIQYTWAPGNFLDDPLIASPIATLLFDYRYIVTGTTTEGCHESDDILVKVYKGPEIYVPSAFSPNNDGLNDLLKAIPVGIKEFRFFRVFNRWGQMLFSTQDPARGWDGRFKGTDQQTGSFVWTAEAVDYKGNLVIRKGVVTVIR